MIAVIAGCAAVGATIVALVCAIGSWRDREDNERLHLDVASLKSEVVDLRARLGQASQTLDEIGWSACAMTAPAEPDPAEPLPERPARNHVDVALNLAAFDPCWVESANVRVTS